MNFDPPLVRARFLRREKRFIIHAELPDGTPVTAHTNNTGRMTGLLIPGADIWLSPADRPERKLKWTLELADCGTLAGVNTALANTLAREAITDGLIGPLSDYTDIRAEVAYPWGGSRADFLLCGPDRPDCWVEVKNVTLVRDGCACFPDAPTARGRKHLEDLARAVRENGRAALVFCVQREDAGRVGTADDIDPGYGRRLRDVMAAGVEIYGIGCSVSEKMIKPLQMLPWSVLP